VNLIPTRRELSARLDEVFVTISGPTVALFVLTRGLALEIHVMRAGQSCDARIAGGIVRDVIAGGASCVNDAFCQGHRTGLTSPARAFAIIANVIVNR